ncbi:MAG: hypothetical protein AAF478_08330 [Pseudomonadota bacterium]
MEKLSKSIKIAIFNILIFVAFSSSVHAETLTTTYNSNITTGGVRFFAAVKSQDLNLTGISVNVLNGTHTFEVHYRPAGQSAYIQHTSQQIVGAGVNTGTFVDIPDLILQNNTTYVFYVTLTTDRMRATHDPSNTTPGFENSDLRISRGLGRTYFDQVQFGQTLWNGAFHYDVVSPEAAVTKSVDVSAVNAAATTLNYQIEVENTGGIALTSPALTDDLQHNGNPIVLTSGPILTGGDLDTNGVLDAGETWTYSASYLVDQSDMDTGGSITNLASFAADNLAQVNSNLVTSTINSNPSLLFSNSANPSSNVPVGTTVTYEYDVTNNGNVTMSDISMIVDTHTGSGTAPVPQGETLHSDVGVQSDSTDVTTNDGVWSSLAPGDTVRMSGTYTVTQSDVDLLQ